jgi:LPXTG-motif cell wall-anchored protein
MEKAYLFLAGTGGKSVTITIILIVVVVVAIAGYFLLRKKK